MVADAELEIGAVVVDDLAAQAGHPAVRIERQFCVVDAVGAVVVAGGEVVDPVFHVFDRTAGRACQGRGDHGNFVKKKLAAEAAARDHRHDVELVRRHAERDGERPADVVVERAVDVDRELADAAIEGHDRAAGLERLGARARPAQLARDHDVGVGEILIERPEREFTMHCYVGGPALRMEHGVAGCRDRGLGIDHRRQLLVVDLDQLERVLGDIAALGGDDRDRLADVAHAVERHAALLDRRIGETGQGPGDLGDVGAGHDQGHARQRLCPADIDRLDARVRVRAAQCCRVQHVRQHDVVDVAALAGQEARVLDPLHALADPAEVAARLLALPARRDAGAGGHSAASRTGVMSSAARRIAAMMVW